MSNIKLSIINDEISDDFDASLEFMVEFGIKFVELRTVNGKNVIDLNIEEIQLIKAKLDKNNMTVSAISSPLFKWYKEGSQVQGVSSSYGVSEILSKKDKQNYIRKAFKIAELLDTQCIRIFSLLRDADKSEIEFWNLENKTYTLAFDLAKSFNKVLLLENGWYTNFYQSKQLIKLLRDIKDLPIQILLDLGNFFYIDEAMSMDDIYEILYSIKYFHLKDYSSEKKEFVPLGEGIIPYKSIIRKIIETDNNDVFFSIELDSKKDKLESIKKSIINFRNLISEIQSK